MPQCRRTISSRPVLLIPASPPPRLPTPPSPRCGGRRGPGHRGPVGVPDGGVHLRHPHRAVRQDLGHKKTAARPPRTRRLKRWPDGLLRASPQTSGVERGTDPEWSSVPGHPPRWKDDRGPLRMPLGLGATARASRGAATGAAGGSERCNPARGILGRHGPGIRRRVAIGRTRGSRIA